MFGFIYTENPIAMIILQTPLYSYIKWTEKIEQNTLYINLAA